MWIKCLQRSLVRLPVGGRNSLRRKIERMGTSAPARFTRHRGGPYGWRQPMRCLPSTARITSAPAIGTGDHRREVALYHER